MVLPLIPARFTAGRMMFWRRVSGDSGCLPLRLTDGKMKFSSLPYEDSFRHVSRHFTTAGCNGTGLRLASVFPHLLDDFILGLVAARGGESTPAQCKRNGIQRLRLTTRIDSCPLCAAEFFADRTHVVCFVGASYQEVAFGTRL
jgi:hypothetical protein